MTESNSDQCQRASLRTRLCSPYEALPPLEAFPGRVTSAPDEAPLSFEASSTSGRTAAPFAPPSACSRYMVAYAAADAHVASAAQRPSTSRTGCAAAVPGLPQAAGTRPPTRLCCLPGRAVMLRPHVLMALRPQPAANTHVLVAVCCALFRCGCWHASAVERVSPAPPPLLLGRAGCAWQLAVWTCS